MGIIVGVFVAIALLLVAIFFFFSTRTQDNDSLPEDLSQEFIHDKLAPNDPTIEEIEKELEKLKELTPEELGTTSGVFEEEIILLEQPQDIMITDGTKHSVPLEEILAGGPVKDGIPPIDNPKFISVEDAENFLNDDEPGIAISFDGVDRFYPFQILVWHEIVNDTLPDGRRILVTYCPLCFSGIVFDPVVQNERVEFGTSGKLWNSNLVMYDRKTDSYWSQVLGEAIVGEETGVKLEVLSSDQVKFGNWKKQFPSGEVLSKKTGKLRAYGVDPYGDYYISPGVYFPLTNKDNRLGEKDLILGLVEGGESLAVHVEAVKKAGSMETTFADKKILAKFDPNLEVVKIYEKLDDKLIEVNPFTSFWFAWVAVHPDTELMR